MVIHLAKDIKTDELPMFIAALAIIPPNDISGFELGIPVYRFTGSYEELRAALHNDVDKLFDAHLKLGDFVEEAS